VQARVCFAAASLAALTTLGRAAYALTLDLPLGSERVQIFFARALARAHTGEMHPCHISHHPRDGSRAPRRICPTMVARARLPQGAGGHLRGVS